MVSREHAVIRYRHADDTWVVEVRPCASTPLRRYAHTMRRTSAA
jgi:hypothetical protein